MRKPKLKQLVSVAHNFAAHARSGLCTSIDGLTRGCRAANVDCITLDFLTDAPNPPSLLSRGLITSSVGSLHERFFQILSSEGFCEEDLTNACASFHFTPAAHSYSRCLCNVRLTDSNGKVHEEWLASPNGRVFLKKGVSKFRRIFDLSNSNLNPSPPVIYTKPYYQSYIRTRNHPDWITGCLIVYIVLQTIYIIWNSIRLLLEFFNN